MKIFFNTLFHGDKKTKILLWSCVIAGIAMVACLIMFIVTLKMPWIFGTIFSLLVPLMILRKYDFSDGSDNGENGGKHPGLSKELLRDAEEAAKILPEITRPTHSVNAVQTPENATVKTPENVAAKAPENVKAKPSEPEKPEKEKKQKPEKPAVPEKKPSPVKIVKPEDVNPVEKPAEAKVEKPAEAKVEKPAAKTVEKAAGPQLLDVDQKELKQILVKYKVKREHKPIIVDSSVKYKISQCPAYIWVFRKRLHLLLLEQAPRELSFDLSRASKLIYSKEKANPATEYAQIRTSRLLSPVFSQCIPIYHEDYVNHLRTSFKNLYTLVDDIKITNTSARVAFDMTKASFELPDKYNLPQTSGQYVREANKTKILWQDGVISTSEFKTRIKNLLEDMTNAKISDREFDMNLHEMVSRQLITKEYADYYGNAR